jgi:hypothetical protein
MPFLQSLSALSDPSLIIKAASAPCTTQSYKASVFDSTILDVEIGWTEEYEDELVAIMKRRADKPEDVKSLDDCVPLYATEEDAKTRRVRPTAILPRKYAAKLAETSTLVHIPESDSLGRTLALPSIPTTTVGKKDLSSRLFQQWGEAFGTPLQGKRKTRLLILTLIQVPR